MTTDGVNLIPMWFMREKGIRRMKIVVDSPPVPGSEKWLRTITASKVPAIVGVSPWKTAYELWREMTGRDTPKDVGEKQRHFDWGHDAEHALAQYWLRHNRDEGWHLNGRKAVAGRMTTEIAYTDTDLFFPMIATLDRRAMNRHGGLHFVGLEFKTTGDLLKNGWGTTEEPEVPAHYQVQVQMQSFISGLPIEMVVLGHRAENGYKALPEFRRVEADPTIQAHILARVEEFWWNVQNDREPKITDLPAPPAAQPRAGDITITQEQMDELHTKHERFVQATEEFEECKQNLLDHLDKSNGKRLVYDGKSVATMQDGRFSKTRLPKDLQAKLADYTIPTTKTDTAAFAKDYPNAFDTAKSDPTIRLNSRLLA